MNKPIIKKISEMERYDQTLFGFSSLKVGWLNAYIKRNGLNFHPFGLPEEFMSPIGVQLNWYPAISVSDEEIERMFGFYPKSHLIIHGHETENPELVKKSIDNLTRLCEREDKKLVIVGFNNNYFTNF